MIEAGKKNKTEASKPKLEDVSLTPCESHQLLGICIELITLCSKVTGKFDPSMGTMIAFARDEAFDNALEIRP
jgi:hypothetical protein